MTSTRGRWRRSRRCELFYEKGSYWSTRAKQEEQEKCIEIFYFANDCERLALRMRAACAGQANLLLASYSREEPYPYYQECWRLVGTTPSRLRVGGIGGALRDTVHTLTYEWLRACDHAMCAAFNDHGEGALETPQRFVDADRVQTFDEICRTVAQRVSMMAHPTLEGRELSVRLLEELGAEVLAKNAPSAEATKTCDLAALDTFLRVARLGLKDATGEIFDWARTLPRVVDDLRYVLERPPVELCLHGANAAKMNLALLSRAVVPHHLDRFVRVDLLQLWHEQHGVFAAVAAQQAIEQIQRWSTGKQKAFIGVLHTADVVRNPLEASPTTPPHANAVQMPEMPFVHQRRTWWFARQTVPQKRTGLDWIGRRIVRATSLIWQLLAYGELELGVVATSVATPVLTQTVIEARIARGLVREKHSVESFANDLLALAASISTARATTAARSTAPCARSAAFRPRSCARRLTTARRCCRTCSPSSRRARRRGCCRRCRSATRALRATGSPSSCRLRSRTARGSASRSPTRATRCTMCCARCPRCAHGRR